jgi:hypothetical protein
MFIKNKKCAWEEGGVLTDETLMANALIKYQVMIQDGTWNAPDKRDLKIFALEAEVKLLAKNTTRNAPTVPSGRRGNTEQDAWAWKKVKPQNGEVTKQSRKKKYHLCPHHEMWTVHEPAKCTLAGKWEPIKKEPSIEKAKIDESHNQHNKTTSLVKALYAIVREGDQEE